MIAGLGSDGPGGVGGAVFCVVRIENWQSAEAPTTERACGGERFPSILYSIFTPTFAQLSVFGSTFTVFDSVFPSIVSFSHGELGG